MRTIPAGTVAALDLNGGRSFSSNKPRTGEHEEHVQGHRHRGTDRQCDICRACDDLSWRDTLRNNPWSIRVVHWLFWIFLAKLGGRWSLLTYINNTSCKSAVRSLNDFIAYGQSKLANILHTNELSRIFKVSQVLSTLGWTLNNRMSNDRRNNVHCMNRRKEWTFQPIQFILVSSPRTFSGPLAGPSLPVLAQA